MELVERKEKGGIPTSFKKIIFLFTYTALVFAQNTATMRKMMALLNFKPAFILMHCKLNRKANWEKL